MSDRAAIVWAVGFVTLGVVALLAALDVWTPSPGWLWPVLLIVLGLALLLAGAVGPHRGDRGTDHPQGGGGSSRAR